MKKIISFWIAVFLVGGAAGIFANQIFLPWLASFPFFNKIHLGTMIVNRTEKIYIQEETAAEDALSVLALAVVGIRSAKKTSGADEILAQGSGLILTSDGLVLTALSLAPAMADKISVLKDSEIWDAKILKKDETNNLILLKVDRSGLPVTDLAENENLKLGEKVLLSGMNFSGATLAQFADVGLVRQVAPLMIQFSEIKTVVGAPLVNLAGEVLGINVLNKKGETEIVLSGKIRELMK